MDILTCPNCRARLLPHEAAITKLPAAGEHCQERNHCCPYCHTVLLIEVTMADDDCPTMSRLTAIEL